MVSSFNADDNQLTQFANGKNGIKKENPSNQYLNYNEDDEMEIQGYVCSKVKTYVVWTFYILTLGVLRLLFHWYPYWHLKATHTRCSLKRAEKVLIIDTYRKFKSYFVKKINIITAESDDFNCDEIDAKDVEARSSQELTFNLCDGRQKSVYEARVINCKKLTYIWDDTNEAFMRLAGFDKGISREELLAFKGQSRHEQSLKRIIYGNNEIIVPVQTILTLLVLEALTPFYIFQLFSLIVWICEMYLYYTIAIIIMSVVGISASIIQTRKNQMNLRGTVSSSDTAVVCRKNGVFEEIPTTFLVPGDLLVIPSTEYSMQCDAVLLNGNCVVNESMLTGESVPITKTPLPCDFRAYNLKEDTNHTLFCGTKIIQTRSKGNEKVFAVVIRTGYLTAKGELVRSILYPPPADFQFEKDSYKFIGILFAIALMGVIYTIVSKYTRKISALDILIKSLDIFTIAVPPALPAAMTVGKLYALNRLKNKKIFCINSRVINVSGTIDCICFDKTGTLTEDELDMWGIVPVEDNEMGKPLKKAVDLPMKSAFIRGMATCHSLSIINEELGGDPLDIKMFESTEWILEDSNELSEDDNITVRPGRSVEDSLRISIIKQFQFSSTLQRMSVIVKSTDSSSHTIFCKGSPEMITSLSNPSSVPDKLLANLANYTSQGYRVIALATKNLENMDEEVVMKLNREDVESDLTFVGLIVLENKLKPQTSGVIYTLKNANLKVVMITGDNIQTGVHVARECQIVDPSQYIIEVHATAATKQAPASISYDNTSYPTSAIQLGNGNGTDIEKWQKRDYCFAVSGSSWANIVDFFPDLVPKIVAKGVVFARMSGMQKQQLIEELKNLGYYVAMCGDGANDCGALKAAHVGISLSEAESSVASPFTSKEQNISCVPKVIKEGRAALVTSFGVFKVMLCYSLTEFASVMILYNIDANLGAMEFLFIDICLILNFAAVFGMTKAYRTLNRVPPMTSLVGFIPITSMFLFMCLAAFFQVIAYHWIQTYNWFVPFVFVAVSPNDQAFICYENYAVYCVSMFQYITMVVVFSKGKPYRKPLYTNIYFTLSLLLTTVVCVYITLIPHQWVRDVIQLEVPPMEGRCAMLVIAFICFVTCWVVEDLIVEYLLGAIIVPKCRGKENSRQKYLGVLNRLNEDPTWPMIDNRSVTWNEVCEQGQKGFVNNGFVGSFDTLVTRC